MGTIQERNRHMSSVWNEAKVNTLPDKLKCFMCGHSSTTNDFEWKVMNKYFYICPNCNSVVITKENYMEDIFRTVCFLSFFSILSNSSH
jgi:transcription elongation factor Elf1